jgi:hypothetical protein
MGSTGLGAVPIGHLRHMNVFSNYCGRIRPSARGLRRRLRALVPERGFALLPALGAITALSIAGTSIAYYSTANSRSAYRSKADSSAYGLAEAGINDALSILTAAQDPRQQSALPPKTETLDNGTVSYSGVIDANYVWTITSTGHARDGIRDDTRTITRLVAVKGLAPGSDIGSWNRFYHDSTSVCLTIDTVTIPMPIASRGGMCLINGGSVQGAGTTVDVGTNLTVTGPNASSGPRSPTIASGWTSSTNAFSSNNSYATNVIAAGATGANLNVTGLGFTIPSTAIIRGVSISIEHKSSTASSLRDATVNLLKAGAASGSNKANTGSYWGTSDSTASYGSSSDLWGTTWTAAQINASDFGVRLAARNYAGASATASADQITVTVTYSADVNVGLGTSSVNITQASIGGTCKYNAAATHNPCTSADRVYANTINNTPEDLVKPQPDLAFWYENAKPGPAHNCTTGSFPGGFDNDTVYNNSRPSPPEVTPTNVNYTCQVWENGALVGELSWNYTTHVLNIKGTIFVDGDFRFDDDGQIVHYQGRGIIYAAGDIEYDEIVCAGGSGTTNCITAGMASWSPATNMMVLLSGGNSEYDQGGSTCTPGPTCPGGHPMAGFQGVVYAAGDCLIHENFNLSGPVVCNTMSLPYEADGWPSYYTWPSLGSLVDGQKYADTATANFFELDVGDQTG